MPTDHILNLHFFSDAGHGWLRVHSAELDVLEIRHLISGCSYEKGLYAYLEEDIDAAVYIKALKDGGIQFKVIAHNSNTSHIRSFESFIPSSNYDYDKATKFAYC